MEMTFSKYQGAGNDFILLDNLSGDYDDLTDEQVVRLCDRKFGVGADGLIMINQHADYDYEVDYYNADASKSFCGNGGRCAAMFAQSIGAPNDKGVFLGFDGPHHYAFEGSLVHISMRDVNEIIWLNDDAELYTGSPHYVKYVKNIEGYAVYEEGKSIRNSDRYHKQGINVNFVEELAANELVIRTYERGVEDETLACGTGVTACAIVQVVKKNLVGKQRISLKAAGGDLAVELNRVGETEFNQIVLIGPAKLVFTGEISI